MCAWRTAAGPAYGERRREPRRSEGADREAAGLGDRARLAQHRRDAAGREKPSGVSQGASGVAVTLNKVTESVTV